MSYLVLLFSLPVIHSSGPQVRSEIKYREEKGCRFLFSSVTKQAQKKKTQSHEKICSKSPLSLAFTGISRESILPFWPLFLYQPMILIKTTCPQRASSRSRHCQDGSLFILILVAICFKWQYSESTQREMYSYCSRESFDIMTLFDWGLGSLV